MPARCVSHVSDLYLNGASWCVCQDGKGVTMDPLQTASDCGNVLRNKNNMRTPPPATPGLGSKRRFQFLADGVGFYRAGRMATRVGIRCMDAIWTTNSRFFFWSCSLFLNNDHYAELKLYLKVIFDKLNTGLKWTKERGQWRFLISNKSDVEQLEFKLEKIIGI